MFNFKTANIADFLETVSGLKNQSSLFPGALALLGNGRCWSGTSITTGSAPSNEKEFFENICILQFIHGARCSLAVHFGA